MANQAVLYNALTVNPATVSAERIPRWPHDLGAPVSHPMESPPLRCERDLVVLVINGIRQSNGTSLL